MTTRYRRRPDLRMTELEGEGVVLHLGSRRYFSVNQTGLAILEALASPQTLDQLVRVVIDRYEVSETEAAAGAREFVNRCVAAELLVAEDGD